MQNSVDLTNWKECDINTDSLWIINTRDKSGKHSNIYHGNFIPQIPYQLISRYTKKDEVVLDAFLGSGTSLYECEKIERKCIGLDLNGKILDFVAENMPNFNKKRFAFYECDSTNKEKSAACIKHGLSCLDAKSAQFAIFHPPYMDIIKFSDKAEDLSNIDDLRLYIAALLKSCENILKFVDKNRYFAFVIGDVYKRSEVVPLAFYVMEAIKKHFKVKLKGIVIKNIEGNRGKLGNSNIWRYRALKSDYYIFKHEYIFVFKKEF